MERSLGTLGKLLGQEITAGEQDDGNFPISKACQISIDAVALARMTFGACAAEVLSGPPCHAGSPVALVL
jgi:hypothetical protein